MWNAVKQMVQNGRVASFHHRVERVLALHRRGEVRTDGLQPIAVSSRLEICWRARDVHPWDRAQTGSPESSLFVRQCLSDTDAVLTRLFDAFPHLDAIRLRVVAMNSDDTILTGTIYRTSLLEVPEGISLGMKLRTVGVVYHSDGTQFEVVNTVLANSNHPASNFLTKLGQVT